MKITKQIEKKHILVIGDVMLDTYYLGSISRISPEAPVPVFRKKDERSVLGGAANVASNLIAANQQVSIMSIIGDDEAGRTLKNEFESKQINTDLLFSLKRSTTVKTRFMANNNQQVLRLDVENCEEIASEDCGKMLAALEKKIQSYDLVLLSDYLKGLLSYEFTQGVIELAKRAKKKVVIDVKDPSYKKYAGAYLLKPNLIELKTLTQMPADTEAEIVAASRMLLKRAGCENVLTTCGARGMILVTEKDYYKIPSVGKEVFDVTGAGDTTIAYLSACIVNGVSLKKAINIANYAAGVQVGKVGTSDVSLQEVEDSINGHKKVDAKILSGIEVELFREKNLNKQIVFTNGCFDILHIGHVRYLQKASELGDVLVVGLNSDSSVKRLKGPERPINSEGDRAELLASLGFVDYVVIFEDDTPKNLIQMIQPDVLVKGGDYSPEQVVGKDIVEARGGRLELIEFVEGKSTTSLIDKIKA